MIKLINGSEVKYTDDFDRFFQNLLEAIISESKKNFSGRLNTPGDKKSEKDALLQEMMDNCIYVTHQLFNLYKDNEKLTEFIITGFIFNSVIMAMPQLNDSLDTGKSEYEGDTFH